MHKIAACILLGSLVGACAVGDEGVPAETDDRNEKLGILCNAEFDVTGSFTTGMPARPADAPDGCWPVGTWTFTATQRTNECPTTPAQFATTYSFRVDRDLIPNPDDPTAEPLGWDETYTYLGDMSKFYRLKVSEGGGGDCEGGLELFSEDGTEFWNLKPALTGTSVAGFAEYAKYDSNQKSPDGSL